MIKKYPYKLQVYFVRMLSSLLSTNISLVQSLDLIIKMEKYKKIKRLQEIIRDDVLKGISLSNSLRKKEISFNAGLISIIENGENSGTLTLSIKKAYEDIERRGEIKKKIIGAFIYPCFILVATILMSLFLILFIFPKIFPLLTSLNIKLPILTRLVSELYKFMIHYGLYTFLLLILFFITIHLLQKRYINLKILIIKIINKIPVLGNMKKIFMISNHFHSISLLLEYNRPLLSILSNDTRSHSDIVYRNALLVCEKDIERGISFSESMSKSKDIFTDLSINLVNIGEKTGNLSEMLQNIAKMYESEIENNIKRLSVTIEPLLMIFMGIIVGGIALSIILPIYEITNHLQK